MSEPSRRQEGHNPHPRTPKHTRYGVRQISTTQRGGNVGSPEQTVKVSSYLCFTVQTANVSQPISAWSQASELQPQTQCFKHTHARSFICLLPNRHVHPLIQSLSPIVNFALTFESCQECAVLKDKCFLHYRCVPICIILLWATL